VFPVYKKQIPIESVDCTAKETVQATGISRVYKICSKNYQGPPVSAHKKKGCMK
jgi:hypothetical protein